MLSNMVQMDEHNTNLDISIDQVTNHMIHGGDVLHWPSGDNMLPSDQNGNSLNFSINQSTNQLQQGGDLLYYPNGNVLRTPMAYPPSQGYGYIWTAEGYLRCMGVYGVDPCSLGSYLYNGMGERTFAQHQGGSVNAMDEYVYLNGQTMGDWRTDSYGQQPWVWNDFIYANGQKIARVENRATPVTHYYVDDHLGTTQMELSSTGVVEWQGYFSPYGKELSESSTAIGPQDPSGTNMRFKFTGKERDTESGLDYFGARMYASSMGRFMSPDWSAKAEPVPYAKLDNPQSLNLYAYVNNNPLRSVDPDGHEANGCAGSKADTCSVATDTKNKTATITEKNQTLTNNKDASGKVVSTTLSTTTTVTTVTTGANAHVEGATQTKSSSTTSINPDGSTKTTTTPTQTTQLNTSQLIQQNPGRVAELTNAFSPSMGERAMDHKVGIGGVLGGGGVAIGCALAEPCGAAVVVGGVLVGAGAAIYDMATH